MRPIMPKAALNSASCFPFLLTVLVHFNVVRIKETLKQGSDPLVIGVTSQLQFQIFDPYPHVIQ